MRVPKWPERNHMTFLFRYLPSLSAYKTTIKMILPQTELILTIFHKQKIYLFSQGRFLIWLEEHLEASTDCKLNQNISLKEFVGVENCP